MAVVVAAPHLQQDHVAHDEVDGVDALQIAIAGHGAALVRLGGRLQRAELQLLGVVVTRRDGGHQHHGDEDGGALHPARGAVLRLHDADHERDDGRSHQDHERGVLEGHIPQLEKRLHGRLRELVAPETATLGFDLLSGEPSRGVGAHHLHQGVHTAQGVEVRAVLLSSLLDVDVIQDVLRDDDVLMEHRIHCKRVFRALASEREGWRSIYI